MKLEARQAMIVGDAAYFSNFAFTKGAEHSTIPVIAAYNLTNRKLIWQIKKESRIPIANDNERLFVLTEKGIEALSMQDGSAIWQTSVGSADHDPYYDELLIGGALLFYSANQSDATRLYALNPITGAVVWTTSLSAPTDWFKPSAVREQWDEYRAVNYDRGQLYVRLATDVSGSDKLQFKLTALDAANGHELWAFPFETPSTQGDSPPFGASRPTFDEHIIYFGTFSGVSYALDRDSGRVVWERQMNMERPVYINGQIVALSGHQKVVSLDARTGDMNWIVPYMESGIGTISPFVFSNGYLIFYAGTLDEGWLSVVDLKSGRRLFSSKPDFPSECDTFPPVALALYQKHLYLSTLNCVNSFALSR